MDGHYPTAQKGPSTLTLPLLRMTAGSTLAVRINQKGSPMSQPDDLRETLDQLVAALNRFLTGDPGGLLELWSHADDVTIFGGFGSYERGWEGVKQNTE